MPDPAETVALVRQVDKRTRRHLLLRMLGRIVVTTTALLAVYFLVPDSFANDAVRVVWFFVCLLGVLAAIGWQVNTITKADYPRLRAVEVVLTAIPLIVVMFGLSYVAIVQSNAASFNQPLDRLSTLYFTVTVLSTVGFGDIVPKTDPARLVVMIQMIVDLILIGFLIRMIFTATEVGIQHRRATLSQLVTDGPTDEEPAAASASASASGAPAPLDTNEGQGMGLPS